MAMATETSWNKHRSVSIALVAILHLCVAFDESQLKGMAAAAGYTNTEHTPGNVVIRPVADGDAPVSTSPGIQVHAEACQAPIPLTCQ